jgi:transposase InsO family protein
VFGNRVLRRIFGPKRDDLMGERRKLHSGQLHNLYSSPDIIRHIKSRRMRWAGHVARMAGGEKMYRVLVGKPEAKRPLERLRRRWEDEIKMDLSEIGLGGGVEWIYLAQDRDLWRPMVNAVMHPRIRAPRT